MTKMKVYSLIFVPFFAVMTMAFIFGGISLAKDHQTDNIARVSFSIGSEKVDREAVLREFLEKYNSPLLNNVDTFIAVADKYGIDYRLLPAISCMESTCGKRMPYNSNNAWGWGVYGNNVIRFANFDEGIETVGKGLHDGYISRGLDTPHKIAPVYTPPRANHWLNGVSHFMSQMDEIAENSKIS